MKRVTRRIHLLTAPVVLAWVLSAAVVPLAAQDAAPDTADTAADAADAADQADAAPAAGPAGLAIGPDDIRIDQSIDGGYDLWVRKREGISSVLLTESTEAPDRQPTTFAFRSPEYNAVNGDERRILDGEFLPDDGRYFLIDSTPEPDEEFGEAFHIFIPYIVEYGYPWSRSGEVQVLDGTYLSIRTFERAFADYRGAFRDNPFIVRVEQAPMEGPPEGNFMPDTVDSFSDISDENDGETRYSSGPEDTVSQIAALIPDEGERIDLVLALDTTQSMRDDMPVLRDTLVGMLSEELAGYESFRIGFMLYRDYLEDYLVRKYDFVETFDLVQDRLNRIRVAGGRDIPEAVYEALWASVEGFEWAADERRIILIGDAPPHPRPRGSVTRERVFERARELELSINTIILPQ